MTAVFRPFWHERGTPSRCKLSARPLHAVKFRRLVRVPMAVQDGYSAHELLHQAAVRHADRELS